MFRNGSVHIVCMYELIVSGENGTLGISNERRKKQQISVSSIVLEILFQLDIKSHI